MKNQISLIVLLLCVMSYCVSARGQVSFSDTTVANFYIDKAERFVDELNIDSALILYEKAQKIHENVGNKYGYIVASNGLGECLARSNKLLKGLLLLQNTQKYITDNMGDNNMLLADNYNKIAVVYYFMSNFNEAITNLQLSLALKEKLLPPNHKSIADSYNNLGVIHDMLGEKELALEAYLKSVEILKSSKQSKKVDLANTLENIAIVYYDIAKFQQAIEYEEEARRLFVEEFGNDHLKSINSYELIGVIYYSMERLKQAEVILKEAFNKKSLMLEPTNIYMINSYINLANLYFAKGDANKALELHLEALKLYSQYSGSEENYTYIDLCNNIGNDYDELGQFNLAIEYHLKTINLAKKIFSKKHVVFASYYNNLATSYLNRKEFETALEYLLKAEGILLKSSEKQNTLVNVYSNLGNCYYNLKDNQKSDECFQKSLNLINDLYGDSGSSLGTIYSNKGSMFLDNNDLKNAQVYFQKSLNIRKELFGIKNPNVASSYVSIGLVHFLHENYDSALINYQKAYQANLPHYYIKKEKFGIDIFECPRFETPYQFFELLRASVQKLACFEELYSISKDIKYLYSSHRHYFFADTALVRLRNGLTKSSERLIYSEMLGDIYPNAAKTCYEIFKLTADSSYLEDAFYFFQKGKSLLLIETMNGINAMKIAGIPNELIHKERKLLDEVSYYRRMILSGSKDEFDGYYDTIYVLNRKLDNLTNVLKSKYPKYYNLKYNLNLFSIKEIQSQLDSTECLVSYTDGEYYYLAAFITKTTFSIKTIEVDENFDEELKYLRYSMMYPKSERFKKIFLKNASEVYETLFPVKFDKNIEKLIIIPDSRLSTIPFEALLTNPTEIETEYSDYPFLLKDYNICYHYTEKLAFEEYKTTKSDVVSDFIAFAPVFSDKSTNSTNQRTAQILQNMQSNSDTVVKNTRMVDRNFISALPGTEEEVKLIYNLFDSKDIKAAAYFYSSASESVVKSLDLTKYRFIHFATHGFADNENPELSGLILAHDSSKSEDNVLYLDEIIGLEMEPELAVLSACETGLGKIYKGEGMVGLSRSIIYSGAKNLCVSLWQVSDESTKKLMVDFYNYYLEQNANDHEFASSFRKAKLNLINSKSYSHPFYWAPFILIGK